MIVDVTPFEDNIFIVRSMTGLVLLLQQHGVDTVTLTDLTRHNFLSGPAVVEIYSPTGISSLGTSVKFTPLNEYTIELERRLLRLRQLT